MIPSPIIPAPPAKLQQQVVEISSRVKTLQISSADEYLAAGEISRALARLRKEVEEAFNPIIEIAHQAHKKALEQRKKYLMPLELDQRKIDSLILSWDRQQEEHRRALEEELAVRERLKAEDQALAEADELARTGDHDLAEEVLNQAAAAPSPVVALPSNVPKIEGVSKRTIWRWRITNPDQIPREFLRVDDVKISGVVRALKNATKIPGVQVYPEEIASHRS